MIPTAFHTDAKVRNHLHPANIILVLCLALLALMSSCSVPDKEKNNPLTRHKMVEILVDIHLTEARADRLMIVRDSILPQMKTVYGEILVRNKVTEQDYRKTMDYYLQNPTKLDTMYQEVVDELSKREALQTGTAATIKTDSATAKAK